ncbi:TRAM domain-containing protein [Candidatus Saccharibacteria bacterium]|nr:TRAM domain-containing protein [Candidatus Saccharibacteria bacterium]
MELFFLLIGVGIFIETSYLTIRKILEKTPRVHGRRKVFVDTSALMDGRILEVAKTGFLSDDLLIPRSVIREMQLLADGKDSEKRVRARLGMEVASELERIVYFDTEIFDDSELGRELVDERLITLAKKYRGVILTCDYNLAKVAATERVEVLNVNDLALVLGNKRVSGEKIRVKIIEKGLNPGQGVGHLDDGTMVVVSGAEKYIGKETDVIFVRFLQTASGRMIFAELPAPSRRKATGRKSRSTKKRG